MSSRIMQCIVGLTLAGLSATPSHAQSTAFFYGPSIPDALSTTYDRIVVEPGHGFDPVDSREEGTELVAYISIGEVATTSADHAELEPTWILSTNADWNSAIVDLSSKQFRRHLLQTRFEPLYQRGYRTFFLDTLDSYQRLPKNHGPQRQGLIELVRAMHRSHADVRLIANRGFEVIADLAPILSGMVAESLFDRFDAGSGRYVRVAANDRRWLLAKLRETQDKYDVPVTVIDYRPPAQRTAALHTAKRIMELGFAPYVTDGALHGIGTGPFEILPRKVLVLTNAGETGASRAQPVLGPLLEYLGYVPEYHDVADDVPTWVPGDCHATIVWLEGKALAPAYPYFVEAQLTAGVRYLFFGDPRLPFTSAAAERLGFKPRARRTRDPAHPIGPLHLRGRTPLAANLLEPHAIASQLSTTQLTGPNLEVHLEALQARPAGNMASPGTSVVATAPWGGAALSHFLVPNGLHGEIAFNIDPIAFLGRALNSDRHPKLDLTTENGQRLGAVIVRGAGLAAASKLPGRPTNLQSLKRIMREHPVPHTLDLTPSAANPVTPLDARKASSLFKMYRVEAGNPEPSHTVRLQFQGTLAELTSSLSPSQHALPAATLAGDYHYIPNGISESFPYSRLAETLGRTDSPRRLCPAVLDFHASSLASPGGYAAVRGLYRTLRKSNSRFVSMSALRKRASGFVAGVMTRHVDGAYELRGAAPLRTLRLPDNSSLIAPSLGIEYDSVLPQGHYVTVAADCAHKLYLQAISGHTQSPATGAQ